MNSSESSLWAEEIRDVCQSATDEGFVVWIDSDLGALRIGTTESSSESDPIAWSNL